MKNLAPWLIAVSLVTYVIGQLYLKRAMDISARAGLRSRSFVSRISLGIIAMTVSFFLSLGLLAHLDLSYLYPFQGFSVIIIAVVAALALREKLTPRLLFGSILITTGIVLVSLS